jgi:hypothetical protein
MSGMDTKLSGRGHSDSWVFVFVNLVAHTPDRNSENTGRPSAAPTMMDECVEDQFSVYLVDRVTDKVRNDLFHSQSLRVFKRTECGSSTMLAWDWWKRPSWLPPAPPTAPSFAPNQNSQKRSRRRRPASSVSCCGIWRSLSTPSQGSRTARRASLDLRPRP